MVTPQVEINIANAIDGNTNVKGIFNIFGQFKCLKVHIQGHGIIVGASVNHTNLVINIS